MHRRHRLIIERHRRRAPPINRWAEVFHGARAVNQWPGFEASALRPRGGVRQVDVNAKYFILIVAVLAVIHYLLAGSAPPANQAPVAPQAKVAPIAPSSIAPTAPAGPVAPIGPAPTPAPTAPVASSPIAPVAPVAPTPPQSVNSNFPVYPYAYAYHTNSAYFTNGIPTAYLRNTNSVAWTTNAPYGNSAAGYTNNNVRYIIPYRPTTTNTYSPPTQQQ